MDGKSAYGCQEHSYLSAMTGAETLAGVDTLVVGDVGVDVVELIGDAGAMENPPPPQG